MECLSTAVTLLKVVLLAGQSNVVGDASIYSDNYNETLTGKYESYALPASKKILYSERILNQSGIRSERTLERLQPNPTTGQFGPELSLGRSIKSKLNDGEKLLILKFGKGGTSIQRFLPSDDTGVHTQLDSFLTETKQWLDSCQTPYVIDKVVWIHGEANARRGHSVYTDNFSLLVDYLASVGMPFEPLFVPLRPAADYSNEYGVSELNSNMCAVYECSESNYDLSLSDYYHYTGNDYMRLGLRAGRAF